MPGHRPPVPPLRLDFLSLAMLFNSYSFLLLYLPVTAFVFFRLGAYSHKLAAAWLAAASLFFYGWWNPAYVGLLLASIFFNYGVGIALAREWDAERTARRHLILALGVGADLALLGYFKYANFFVDTANRALGLEWEMQEILLPLGISFFTFTQIAFLADAWAGKAREYNFIHYLLFVTYFPHLIAGPVLHHKEMMPQFARPETYVPAMENIAVGLTIFSIGLFKKAVLADGIAPYANAAFRAADQGESIDLLMAWGGVLAYANQIYFDFSGYSDMAIGLSRVFGVVLPLNFNSPYQATSIADFWRRWHITLSRFLRDYLYVPLGGNRRGPARRWVNLMATMLLGGLWHGASWNFVVWGGLHGLFLAVNHAWVAFREARSWHRLPTWLAWALTFAAVLVAWVFFRATTTQGALGMLAGMAGLNGVSLPSAIAAPLGGVANWLAQAGVTLRLGGGSEFVLTWGWSVALLAIALLLPNTQEIMRHYRPGLDFVSSGTRPWAAWRPSVAWAWAIAVLSGAGALSLSGATEFLYYQF